MIIVEPDCTNPINVSILLVKPSISLILIEVAPVCVTLFRVINPEPGSPLCELVLA